MTAYEFLTPPMAHQRTALRKIIDNQGICGLLMDPGTGKSKVVIDYLAMLTLKHGRQDWMITAPLSALASWPDEFDRHLPDGVKLDIVWLGGAEAGSIETKANHIRALPPVEKGLRVVLLNHDAFGSRARATGSSGGKLKTVSVWDRLVEAIETWHPDGVVVDESHRLKSHTSHRSKALARIGRITPKRLALTGTVAPRNPLDLFGQWQFLNPATFGRDY
ncbi:MAG: DEAD/DEAH box helicase family protein, partial [Thioalkalivibrio sp.]|nr:DEAD/DEAH box helicase family protein [Thioalkalivibrio sp.]